MNETTIQLNLLIEYTENLYKIIYLIKKNMNLFVIFLLNMLKKLKKNLFFLIKMNKKIKLNFFSDNNI